MGSDAEDRRPIQAVLFDLDNTLYDRDLAFSKWATGFVDDQFTTRREEERAQIVEHIIAIDAHGYVTKDVLFTEVKAHYPSIMEDVAALCERFYKEWLVHMALDPATEALLDFLDRAAIPFGIVTNGALQQHDKIRQLSLQHRTHCLFVSAEFGCNKPDPSIFRAAAACLGVPCEHILFVGDNPAADICGAQAVGMQTAWLHCGATWPDSISDVTPDHVIASLVELLVLLSD